MTEQTWSPAEPPRWRVLANAAPPGSVLTVRYVSRGLLGDSPVRRRMVKDTRSENLTRYVLRHGPGSRPTRVRVAFGKSDVPLAGELVLAVLAEAPSE